MDELIQRDDAVTLYYTDGSVLRGVVIHEPGGEGDSWQIKVGNAVHLINVYASTFESMVKEVK